MIGKKAAVVVLAVLVFPWRASSVLVLALAALTGCGADSGPPEMFVSLGADWDYANRQAFGCMLTMTLNQRRVGDRCDAWPAPVRFTIDGEEEGQSVPSSDSRCIDLNVVVGPTLEVRETVTVRYETEGRLLATASYHRLAPGLLAALAVPADGQARAGDEIVVVPPPELPTSVPVNPRFYPLDEAQASSWLEAGVHTSEPATRLPDGIHLKVPPLTGQAALVIDGTGWSGEADVSCDGFAGCSGRPAMVLGPVYLTVQP